MIKGAMDVLACREMHDCLKTKDGAVIECIRIVYAFPACPIASRPFHDHLVWTPELSSRGLDTFVFRHFRIGQTS